ncbi:Glucose/arabinose dehydrogenase, beta-propeller fold [Halobacillus dabanensis]|uniref:Glucose/arabinose dehydrogenase, beta-propeller fold n=1 Tax=Halobacillus dabanensis TaxID=240302 RepID=A0A1I3RBW8_HALDA|nr:PQQ-dependent sugar dehydrogenase [Halobacillus dabanensis]SFJ42827.1 Glucose/arabinose dehydrogenase, beta-propeller fold [Halobacillus dabanensis]
MKKILSIIVLTLLFIGGCSENEQQNSGSEQTTNGQENPEVEVVTENLDVPWSIEKHNDTFYIIERPGNIVKIEEGEVIRQNVELEKEIATASEAGLLGFVLSPDFSESKSAYAYYTYENSKGQFNRIIELRLEDDVWREESLLLDNIPSGSWHHGGRIKIGPDGNLYATTGDGYEEDIAQDLHSLGGKVLRMNLDGSIPSDNPFPNSYVYSYGHRNPQGITWSSEGFIYASEHGDNANDEINLIEPGQNYGWPIIEGHEEQEGMVPPLFTSGENETWAPSGMDYYDGRLYVAALRGSALLEFDLDEKEHREVITGLGRLRDVLIVDGSLYFISNNTDGRGNPEDNDDKLYKIPLSSLER